MGFKKIPSEALSALRRRLATLPQRSRERRDLMQETAALYGVSERTLYRMVRDQSFPRAMQRSDQGQPHITSKEQMERYCEVIAAIKIRTSNRKGRHLSTSEAIRLLEDYGVDTTNGRIQVPPSLLKKTTVNRYLKQWGYTQQALTRTPPAVRFQARYSNECWHFDLSPSDLKHIKKPAWFQKDRGHPLLMLYSVVDDRSGVSYQEYHGVYGEDVEAALRFLFAAMSPKKDDSFPFMGRPRMLYMDNGPIARSAIFRRVMDRLDIEVKTHLPQKKSDKRKKTARAKGKVERPFRTVKEMLETLYHFHEPETEEEANAGLSRFLLRYNNMQHRSELHSRFEDWLKNIPSSGIRAMCEWERFCRFAREPENKKVGIDARITVDGVAYQVDAELVEQDVVVWWGLYDNELYVEYDGDHLGPYRPIDAPVPLHKYRNFKKTKFEQRAERIDKLAAQIQVPKAAIFDGNGHDTYEVNHSDDISIEPFEDPDPFEELRFPDQIEAKVAVANTIGLPLAKLPKERLDELNAFLERTLDKKEILEYVRLHLQPMLRR